MITATEALENIPVRRVPLTRPFVWLSEAWDDLLYHRSASLAYGILVAVLGTLILAYERHPFFLAAVTSGFLLIGPIMTAGLCELSRCQDHGEEADFQSSLLALSRNRGNLTGFAVLLLCLALVWFFASGTLLYLMLGDDVAPSVANTVWGDVLTQLSQTQLLAYLAVGGSLSAVVFAMSAVTIPMMIERHVDAKTAIRMSLRVTLRDWPAMLVWAAIIVLLVLVGFATKMLGMVIIFPILGHATWYAYRETVTE